MPLDATRYQIEIAAADKTAAAFASVDRRVRQIEQQTRRLNQSMAAGGVGAGKAARDIGNMGAGAMLASRGVGALGGGIARLAPALAPAAAAWYVFNAGMKAGALVDQAEQLGVTMEALQAYRVTALQVGVTSDQMDGALQRLRQAWAPPPAAATR